MGWLKLPLQIGFGIALGQFATRILHLIGIY